MKSIFLSYRRGDSRAEVGRLDDRLVAHFGEERVFKDVDSIPLGTDFREILTQRVAACDVFLAVIGDGWLSAVDNRGRLRLDDPNDFVRFEIEAALEAEKVPLIPVLVGNSPVPKAEELPKSLRELSFKNGLSVRPDPDFHTDVDRPGSRGSMNAVVQRILIEARPRYALRSMVFQARGLGSGRGGLAGRDLAPAPERSQAPRLLPHPKRRATGARTPRARARPSDPATT